MGCRARRAPSRSTRRAARCRRFVGSHRHDVGALRGCPRDRRQRHRRRPTGRLVRAVLRRPWDGQEHLRHGQLHPAEHRLDLPAAGRWPAHHRCMDARRRDNGLRPGGVDLRHRCRRAVAPRRARVDRPRRRGWSAGAERARQRRRLHRPGVHRARITLVGSVRPWHGARHQPRHDAGAPRPRRRRSDGLPDERRDRSDGPRWRHDDHRAARRRWRQTRWTRCCSSKPISWVSPSAVHGTTRRPPSGRRSSPDWPRGSLPTSTTSPVAGRSMPRSSPAADRGALDAGYTTWLRAVERSRGFRSPNATDPPR